MAAANGPATTAAATGPAAAPPAEAAFALRRGTLEPWTISDEEEGPGEAADPEGTDRIDEGAAAAEAAAAEGAAEAAPENTKSAPDIGGGLALAELELRSWSTHEPVGEDGESNIALWSESERPAGWVDPCFSRLSRDPLALRACPCGCGAPVEGSSAGDLAESGPPVAAGPTIGADCDGCSATTAAERDAPSSGLLEGTTAHAADGWRRGEGGKGDGEEAARWASAGGAATAAAAAGLGSLLRGNECACGAAFFALGAREGTMAHLLRGRTRRGARGVTREERGDGAWRRDGGGGGCGSSRCDQRANASARTQLSHCG